MRTASAHNSEPLLDPLFRQRIVMLMAATVFFSVLNGTMFNVALPDIRREFALSPSGVSWVLTGYVVVFALAAVTYGKLADIFPLRRLITIGLLLFNLGALLGCVSTWYPLLIFSRLVQASGGGAIPALGMVVATRFFPAELRGRVLGTLAATVALAAGIGPIVGGLIAGTWHWRLLFPISLATLVALLLFRRLLPDEARRAGSFDVRGGLLLGGGVGAVLVAIAQEVYPLAALGALLLLWFWRHVGRVAHPFAPPELLRQRAYRQGLVAVFLAVGPVFGMFLAVPLLLRAVFGLSTLAIGLAIFPGALCAAVLGFFAGRLADRRGSVLVAGWGLTLLVIGFALLAWSAGRDWPLVSLCLVVCYTGFAFIQSSLAKTVSLTLAPARIGVGMGLYNLTFFTSGAFGAALSGKLIEVLEAWLGANAGNGALAYSLLFAAMAMTVAVAAGVFRSGFHGRAASPSPTGEF